MRILGERQGFQTNHSSTSYLFYSPERLDEKTQQLAASFSSRAEVGVHTAAYTYNVEGYDLPSEAEDKLLKGLFEVMVSESYDWWTFVFTVPHSAEAMKHLKVFDEVYGPDDTGLRIEPLKKSEKIKITIYCRLSDDWVNNINARRGSNVFEVFANKLLCFRDEIVKGNISGMELLAAKFDPENWKKPVKASATAEWFAKNIDASE